jgi:hypothetical protein
VESESESESESERESNYYRKQLNHSRSKRYIRTNDNIIF